MQFRLTNEKESIMKTLVQLANEIENALAPLDTKWFDDSVAWFEKRKQEAYAWRQSDEAKAMCRNSWAYYKKLWALAGGKGNYKMTTDEYMKKCEKVIRARNEKIAYKIRNAGDFDAEIIEGELSYTNNGFDGIYKLKTSEGTKSIFINTIYAGGYNIQALHLRTLVKVK